MSKFIEYLKKMVPSSPGSRQDWVKWTSVTVASILLPGGIIIPLICLTMKGLKDVESEITDTKD